jgi:hypothetical protein
MQLLRRAKDAFKTTQLQRCRNVEITVIDGTFAARHYQSSTEKSIGGLAQLRCRRRSSVNLLSVAFLALR